jgi:glycosyltransferase involved in cell wall biosynthesis
MAIAPSICFVHDHHRTCLGVKAYTRPQICPCARTFGWQCLALYYPRRCGRASVVKVMRTYAARSRQLKLLRKYSAIVTFSEYMKTEVLKHGCDPRSIHHINFGFEVDEAAHGQLRESFDAAREEVALLFAGRMEKTKGGLILLDSLPRVARILRRPIKLRLAGEGYSRVRWQQHARKISTREPLVKVEFSGWMDETSLANLMDRSDLLIVPSLAPETFGRIGAEAGLRGLPAAAFAVGGIPEWLSDGFNGHLAPANPPSSAGLADAIVKCMRDPEHHAHLRKGATESARRFRLTDHVARLQELFAAVGKQASTGGRDLSS